MALTSVVIVTFNNEGTVKECIDSIKDKNLGCEIIVVDNNSVDKTCSIVESIKGVKLIPSPDNLGFSKGVNIGIKEATGEYIVSINPDAQLKTADGIKKLVGDLESNPEYGIVSPRFINPDGTAQPSVRNFPNLLNSIKEYIFRIKGSYDFYLPKCDELCEVEAIYGACMAIGKSIYQKAGGLDERFFMYYEELDLCQKIKELGLKIGYDPNVEVVHEIGHSGKGQKTSQILVESAKKYHGLLEFYMIQFIIRVSRYVHL